MTYRAPRSPKLERYGYVPTRKTGSHLRLTSRLGGAEHHLSIPLHSSLRVGTLARIVADVAKYRDAERDQVVDELFG